MEPRSVAASALLLATLVVPALAQAASAHWAFTPPRAATPPPVEAAAWPRSAVDHFVLAELERRGTSPAPPADPAAWLRRVTFDLTGLPPSEAELASFLAESAADRDGARERRVDALLASAAHAEEEARLWLDLARYADTHGMQRDQERALWRWRDWVIAACAANLPFDQFVARQLAADLEPTATDEQKVATGFLRNNPTSDEGGLIPEEFLARYAMDRTDHFGTVFLGMTAGCAQCHDHKSDPLPQRDYYRLLAYFASFAEAGNDGGALAPAPAVAAPREHEVVRQRELAAARDAARAAFAALPSPARMTEFVAATVSPWRATATVATASASASTVESPEPADVAWRDRPEWQDAAVHSLGDAVGFTWLRRTLQVPTARTLELAFGSDDGVRLWLDGEQRFARRVQRGAARGQERLEVDLTAGAHDVVLQIENTGGPSGFAFEIARDEGGLESAERRQARAAVASAEAALAAFVATFPPCMVAGDLPEPRPVHVLWRGRYDQPGERVQPGTPSRLPPLPADAPADRRALARWLFQPDHPLTARVAVNRIWARHFGCGLVATPHDFGRLGAPPSHPELLDWLACRLQQDWDVRALHRLLVLSATYAQSSARSSAEAREAAAADPDNIWLARMPRRRLPAEAIRDQALFVGGLLDRTVGGPSVKPWQPAGIWEAIALAGSNTEFYRQDRGDAVHRRSLYVFWKRTAPPALLATFDAPARELCTVERQSTNTPLQALALANDLGLVAAARGFAARLLRSPGDDRARLEAAFRWLLQRAPDADEHRICAEALAACRRHYAGADAAAAAAALLAVGETPAPADLDARELAAWTAVANLLLQLDEALHRG